MRRFLVDRSCEGKRLDAFLAFKVARMSRSLARRIILGGGVELEPPREVKPGRIVRDGDIVVLYQHTPPEELLYDDVVVVAQTDGFVAFDKPAGMLVHGTARAFQNTLTAYAEVRELGPVYVVHRLDQETSGVLVMARSKDSAKCLAAKIGSRQARKVYRALVVDPGGKHVPGESGGSSLGLGFDRCSALPHLAVGRGDWVARTAWNCVRRQGDLADLVVELVEGGRQHQIRAHLALEGTPIIGDKLYLHGADYYKDWVDGLATTERLRSPRQALHAWRLSFELDEQPYALEAPIPELFSELLQHGAVAPRDGKA